MAEHGGSESVHQSALNILLWMVVPGMVTGVIQSVYYWIRYRKAGSRPGAHSVTYKKDHDTIYVLVIGAYLVASIVMVVYWLPPNHYSVFGVGTTAGENDLKRQFRKYSLKYHPDRCSDASGRELFIRLRKIYEVLSNSLSRSVYDKFGEIRCTSCITHRDYIWQGFMEYLVSYCCAGLGMVVLNFIGYTQFATFWRFVIFFAVASAEAVMLVLPYDPIQFIFPNCTVSEKISIIHQSAVYVFVAILNVGPLLFPDDSRDVAAALNDLGSISSLLAKESEKNLVSSFSPFVDDSERLELLGQCMEEKSVHLRLYDHDPAYRNLGRAKRLGHKPTANK